MTPTARLYAYRIVAAVMVLLVARGVISGEEAPLWLDLASAVLGLGAATLAAHHVPTTPPKE